MIIVIADDLSGAIEIAGIGHTYSLKTAILTAPVDNLPPCDLLIFATGTRDMSETSASTYLHTLCTSIKRSLPRLHETRQATMTPLQRAQALARPSEDVLHIFMKTDATLRGHVYVETRVLLDESHYEQAIYVPVNPTRGQTIRGGRYFIDGVPIDQTSCKKDNLFPITTANVAALLKFTPSARVRVYDAEDLQDLHRAVKFALSARLATLLAGSEDLFTVFLEELGRKTTRQKTPTLHLEKGKLLIACGTTEGSILLSTPLLSHKKTCHSALPQDIIEGIKLGTMSIQEAYTQWLGRIRQDEVLHGVDFDAYILSTPSMAEVDTTTRHSIQQLKAKIVKQLIEKNKPAEIILEGNSASLSILNTLEWNRFQVVQQISAGILSLQKLDAPHTALILKNNDLSWQTLLE